MFSGLRHAVAIGRASLSEERKQGPRPARHRDETEFLPAAIEVLETPASPTARVLFWTLSCMLALGLAWSFIGHLDVVAVADGKTVPAGKIKVIQPLETGVVRAIHVQDGQVVKAGDVLIELDPTATGADVRRLVSELVSARVEVARLDAAMFPDNPMPHFHVPAGVPAGLAAMHRSLLDSQTDEYLAKLAALDAETDRRTAEQKSVESGIAKVERALPLLEERLAARQTLADQGYGSKLLALELRQQVVEMQGDLAGMKHQRDESIAALSALRRQRRQAASEYSKDILGQRTEAARKLAGIEEELLKAEQRQELQTLTAPIDGVVQQLAVHTLGGVVTPAQQLLVVVPGRARLEVEAMILNRDIGFIHPGQEVELKLSTFLFTKYGTLPGHVDSVSRDAVQDEKKGLVYPARISLDRSSIDIDGRPVELGAGMEVSAEIKTERRRMIDYLLSPISRYRHDSLRER